MAWALVIVAGLFETAFAVSLKLSEGFSRLGGTPAFLALSAISFTLFSIGLRSLPVGSAYAVWTGIGAAGTAVVGMVFLRDPVTTLRLVSIGSIIGGGVGPHPPSPSAH